MSKQIEVTTFTDNIATLVENEEKSLVKDRRVFDYEYMPSQDMFFWRSEITDLAKQLIVYLNTGIQQNVLVVGSRGSGKTASTRMLTQEINKKKPFKEIYINTRNYPTSYSIYQHLLGKDKHGTSVSELKQQVINYIKSYERMIITLDEVEFLKDGDVFYFLPRNTATNLIMLTQKPRWYYNRLDDSTRSSLQPEQIIFMDYTQQQLREILEKRAQEGLHSWNSDGIARLAALNVRDYLSDVRVGIKALAKLAMDNVWSNTAITEACKKASKDVEEYTIRGLRDIELITLASLLKNKDTNRAFKDALVFLSNRGITLSKTHFFRIFTHLQNSDLVFGSKKLTGKCHTFEAESLLYNRELVEDELKSRFKSK